MNIAIVGLGYVGSVTAACLASQGHNVVGVDVSAEKVHEINAGRSPISERDLSQLTGDAVASGRLRAVTDLSQAWDESEVFLVSVGTPSSPSGDTSLTAVDTVVSELGQLLSAETAFKVIVITSTVPPGTIADRIRPMLERVSGKRDGVDFGLAFSPEFLREGTAVADFIHPELLVFGVDSERAEAVLRTMFENSDATPIVTKPEIAELVKFASNAWHATKVAFSNEIGRVAASSHVDAQEVMRIFALDSRLNISARYLRPGFAFGGSCLPKDVRALVYRARIAGVRVPMLEAVLPSNEEHVAYALRKITEGQPRRVLVLGVAFKAGTDDVRESPAVTLIEALIGKGIEVDAFDSEIQLDRLVGANRAYIYGRLPHIADRLLSSIDEASNDYDMVIVAQMNSAFVEFLDRVPAETHVLDLAGTTVNSSVRRHVEGLTW